MSAVLRGGRARERILVYGPQGSGKSAIGRMLVDGALTPLGADDTLHVIDCDNGWDEVIDAHPEIEERVALEHVRGWEQFDKAMENVWENAAWDDFIFLDGMSWPWSWVQRWYVKRTHGEDLPDFLIDHRMQQIREGKLSARDKADQGQEKMLIEWNFINPLWAEKVAERLVNPPCHLVMTCEAKQIRTDGRDREQVTELYGEYGYKPESQWRLGYNARTVLLLEVSRLGQYRMTTVKDKEGREVLDKAPWGTRDEPGDFKKDYLRKVAGWKPKPA